MGVKEMQSRMALCCAGNGDTGRQGRARYF